MGYAEDAAMSTEKLMEQAAGTARGYLVAAIANVDELMGDGASQKHPELVAALVQASATDYLAAMLSHRVVPELATIGVAITDVRAGLDELGQ